MPGSAELGLQVPPCRVQPQFPAPRGVEERVQLQEPADDGGASGGEVVVAELGDGAEPAASGRRLVESGGRWTVAPR